MRKEDLEKLTFTRPIEGQRETVCNLFESV